jgi:hypothetical protein
MRGACGGGEAQINQILRSPMVPGEEGGPTAFPPYSSLRPILCHIPDVRGDLEILLTEGNVTLHITVIA